MSHSKRSVPVIRCRNCGTSCACFKGRGEPESLPGLPELPLDARLEIAKWKEEARARFQRDSGFCCPPCCLSTCTPEFRERIKEGVKQSLNERVEYWVNKAKEKLAKQADPEVK